MRRQKDPPLLDNKKTKQPFYLSALSIQSPTNKYFFKTKGEKTAKASETNKSREPAKNQEIKVAVEVRFARCRMNYDYKYKNDRKERNSTSSSQMEEFKDLKDLKFCNLVEQNKKLNRKDILTGRSKVNNSSSQSLMRKRETHSPVLGLFLRTSKITKSRRQESPISLYPQREANRIPNRESLRGKSKERERVKLDVSSNKYTTLSPYSRNTRKLRDQASEDELCRGVKSYSTLRINPKSRKIESSKVLTIESNLSKESKKKMQSNRKRMYSHQKL